MKLPESTEKKKRISKNKNDKNVPHLEITKVVLVHCNVVNNYFECESCKHLFKQMIWPIVKNLQFTVFLY